MAPNPSDSDVSHLASQFREAGIQVTPQRLMIAGTLFRSEKHISAEELYFLVREKYPKIGLATIYRTLHLLTEKGLVEEHRFNDEFSRYEVKTTIHHDHLICIECGTVVEFGQPVIEHLQNLAAQENNFTIVSHRLEIYGVCKRCQDQRQKHAPAPSQKHFGRRP
ncbi:MAG: Fur family transcriptional regulator [Leptospirales bacterium]